MEVGGSPTPSVSLFPQEMKNTAGATWDAATAGNAIAAWLLFLRRSLMLLFPTTTVRVCPQRMVKGPKVPTFGYDANSDAVAAYC